MTSRHEQKEDHKPTSQQRPPVANQLKRKARKRRGRSVGVVERGSRKSTLLMKRHGCAEKSMEDSV